MSAKPKTQELVFLQNQEPRVSTIDLYEKFGYVEHRNFKVVINSHKQAFESMGFLPLQTLKPTKGSVGGRPEESYLLNEDQFILLVMLVKNTPQSVELKVRVANEFKRLKKALAKQIATRSKQEWIDNRTAGIETTHTKNDTIKRFVEYATEQGSTNASRYYSNIAKMQNQALFLVEQKFPNVREFLSIRQLGLAHAADAVIESALDDGMEQKIPYKDIYQKAKAAVIAFADMVGKSQIMQLTEGFQP